MAKRTKLGLEIEAGLRELIAYGKGEIALETRIVETIPPSRGPRVVKVRTVRARELRADQTDVERKLWSALGGRRLEGFKFRRQVPIDRYFADFACVEAKLVVELDGSQHQDQAAYDIERTRTLEACGWRVLRFDNIEVIESLDGVCRVISDALLLRTG